MKIVNCLKCNEKLGGIDEKELTIIYEKDVKQIQPHVSMGLLVVPFTCPNCNSNQNDVTVI